MYKLLLAVALFISPVCFCQDPSDRINLQDTSATKKALENAQHTLDSLKNDETYGQMQRNMISFLNYQKEQKAKQRRRLFFT